jgi:lipopolysaccharide export LptBFGC system permease protein LptF
MAGIRIIHRYFLGELFANAVASFLVVFAVFFLAALSLESGKSHFENLPMVVIVKYVGLLLLYSAYLTIPLAIITTCIFTYGRAAQDGEIAAAQTGGIRLTNLMQPAIFLGACGMLLLAFLQDRIMPDAHYASRQVDESVFQNVDQLLKNKSREIREKSFVFKWGAVGEDSTGSLVLDDIELVQFSRDKDQWVKSWSLARRARPVIEGDGSRVVLELEDVHRDDGKSAFWAGRANVPIDLTTLTRTGNRSEADLSYEQLLTGAVNASSARKRDRLEAEFHFRFAMALAPLIFAAFAAPLGVAFRVRNRAVVFLAGVLILTVGYLPLITVARTLCEHGTAPGIVQQAPNVLLAIAAVLVTKRANRS